MLCLPKLYLANGTIGCVMCDRWSVMQMTWNMVKPCDRRHCMGSVGNVTDVVPPGASKWHQINGWCKPVKVLCTFVPVDLVITIIKNKLEQDMELHNRTFMPIWHITILMEVCLKTHISFIMNRSMEQPWFSHQSYCGQHVQWRVWKKGHECSKNMEKVC